MWKICPEFHFGITFCIWTSLVLTFLLSISIQSFCMCITWRKAILKYKDSLLVYGVASRSYLSRTQCLVCAIFSTQTKDLERGKNLKHNTHSSLHISCKNSVGGKLMWCKFFLSINCTFYKNYTCTSVFLSSTFFLIIKVRVKIKCTCQVLSKEHAWNLQTLRKKIRWGISLILYVCFCGDRWITLWHCVERIKTNKFTNRIFPSMVRSFWTKHVKAKPMKPVEA